VAAAATVWAERIGHGLDQDYIRKWLKLEALKGPQRTYHSAQREKRLRERERHKAAKLLHHQRALGLRDEQRLVYRS
jgi:hypothetical protein